LKIFLARQVSGTKNLREDTGEGEEREKKTPGEDDFHGSTDPLTKSQKRKDEYAVNATLKKSCRRQENLDPGEEARGLCGCSKKIRNPKEDIVNHFPKGQGETPRRGGSRAKGFGKTKKRLLQAAPITIEGSVVSRELDGSRGKWEEKTRREGREVEQQQQG